MLDSMRQVDLLGHCLSMYLSMLGNKNVDYLLDSVLVLCIQLA